MIADASALVAILLEEADGRDLAHRFERSRRRATHPISIYEATMAVMRVSGRTSIDSTRTVTRFLDEAKAIVIPIDDDVAAAALEAFDRYGRGRHPAKLNMCDCFSYGVAKLSDMPLLYKGDDFARTDLAASDRA